MKLSNLRKSTPLCLLIEDVFTNYEDTRLIKRNVRIQACIKNFDTEARGASELQSLNRSQGAWAFLCPIKGERFFR